MIKIQLLIIFSKKYHESKINLVTQCGRRGSRPPGEIQSKNEKIHNFKQCLDARAYLRRMYDMNNVEKFVDQIIHLNKLGKENMLADDYDSAICYLQEGQKILEYAASCGKTIDRFLIIATLHNEAAAYQKILQLYKSYDYMEAILYNLKKYFQLNSNINITEEILEKQSPCYKITSSYIHRKINTLIYSLQFAAISSQV